MMTESLRSVACRSVTLAALTTLVSVVAPNIVHAADELVAIRKVEVNAAGAAWIYVNFFGDASFAGCPKDSAGNAKVALGDPDLPANAALLSLAVRARDRATNVNISLTWSSASSGQQCMAVALRDPT